MENGTIIFFRNYFLNGKLFLRDSLDGFFTRKILSIAISLGVGFFYGSLIWQVLPSAPNVSWQAHLFGLIGGILTASLLSPKKKPNKG